jgi:hypothetical protein
MDPVALSEALGALFGDGTYELVEKMSPDGSELHGAAATTHKRKREKRQAQIGLASNVVGITAGAQGLYAANEDFKRKNAEAHGKTYAPKVGAVGRLKPVKAYKSWASKPKNALILAGGAVALQGANLAGDAVANRVLSREAKKDVRVKKGLALTPEAKVREKLYNQESEGLPMGVQGQLVRITTRDPAKTKAIVTNGVETSKKVAVKGIEVGKPIAAKGKQVTKDSAKKVQDRFIAKADNMVIEGSVSKSDSDKRQVFGWASIVEKDGVPVVDLQGDYISVDEVEKAAYEYVQKSRKGGNMHQRNGEDPHHVSDMIESFVLTPEKKEKLGMPESTPTGWWVGFQVHDEETWDQIKTGKRPAFSIHGRGKRQEV